MHESSPSSTVLVLVKRKGVHKTSTVENKRKPVATTDIIMLDGQGSVRLNLPLFQHYNAGGKNTKFTYKIIDHV